MSALRLSEAHHASARARLRERAARAGLDGLLLLHAPHIAYATGLFLAANERPMGLWLPVEGEPILLMPQLELENATCPAIPDLRFYPEFPGEVPPVLWMLDQIGRKRIGIDRLDARLLAPVQAASLHVDLTDHCMLERFIKTDAELALIRCAATYADAVLHRLHAAAGDIIRAGGTEQELMADAVGHVTRILRADLGAEFQGTPLGITASVHSGPRAALPHGAVIKRTPQYGETLISGIGCHIGGYHAESGITLIVGEMSTEQRRVMQAMQACNDAGVNALAARLPCAAVDSAAMEPLRAAGLGDAIRHRIGHGMGLEGHEAPWLSVGDKTVPQTGMVFSNEPGVYRPDRDGYRTINTMIVTDTGVEIPSRFQSDVPIDARVIPL